MNYYNDNEPFVAQWLRNLIAGGLLPEGEVDTRPIQEVEPDDLKSFTQCHFFAGIGGWPLALKLAGWPADRPVWTGSCPCQPFSSAGKRKGEEDARHLWPYFCYLIGERQPPEVFGEQVASKDGRLWLAGVRADLERLGYAVGAADLCAAGIGAPHIRQRLFWVADAQDNIGRTRECGEEEGTRPAHIRGERLAGSGDHGRLADAKLDGRGDGLQAAGREARIASEGPSESQGMGDTDSERYEGRGAKCELSQSYEKMQIIGASPWGASIFIPCADGKERRIEPGIAPLVDGFPGRVGQIRAYGNAIAPLVAAEFIMAYLDCEC